MKKYTKVLLLLLVTTIMSSLFFVNQSLTAKPDIRTDDSFYTIINEDGTVTLVPYNGENPNSSSDCIALTSLDEDINDIHYGVARIKGYTVYNEYDGTADKKQRSGYIHGTSANDAAFIAVINEGDTIRVKQAGIYMDIPASNVEVTEYNENSQVSHYKGVDGKLYHYYYNGSYGKDSRLSATMVGYTPDYLKDGVKYYSYDGHYFYTDYKTMIDDYKEGTDVFNHSVNKNTPYYNYYQYLSLRTPSSFNDKQFNSFMQYKIDTVSSITEESKLYNSGSLLLDIQNTYGINASLMLGIAINESNWGMSYYALDRNNLFGLNAVDYNPDNAYHFDDVEDCFSYFAANLLNAGYLDGSDSRYRGPHLGDKQSGLNVCYSSDPYWGEKAAYTSYIIDSREGNTDYLKYKIAIGNNGNILFNKDSNLKSVIYSSGASVDSKTNYNVYNIPFTIIDESPEAYKIYSDTILKEDRTGLNPSSSATYNILRDYVYIDKNDVRVINESEEFYSTGDVNGDGKVSAVDYIVIKNHILQTKALTPEELIRADINKDDIVSAVDYIMIKNHIMGISTLK